MQPLLPWKSTSITQPVCVCVASVIQRAMRMLHIVFCGLARCITLLHLISLRAPSSKKKVYENKMFISIFSTTFVRNIFHSWKKWARCDQNFILVFMSSSLYSCPILMKLHLSRHSRKKLRYQISWKSVQWEPSCLMRTDGRTWRRKIFGFRNFANAPNYYSHITVILLSHCQPCRLVLEQ
jgi:hypothetical protein